MKAFICGLLALAAASPAIAPIQAMAMRDARLQSILPDDCPLYTDIDDDLEDMGVDTSLYPEVDEGDVALLTMAEWGYTGASQPPDGFGLYLYLYDPQGRDWQSSGNVTMAFADLGEGFYDNSFRPMDMTLLDTSDDSLFSKWSVDDARLAYPLLDATNRRYLLGQATLTDAGTGESLSFGIGKEFDWTGYPKAGDREFSTLTMSKTGFQYVRAEVHPFMSDAGGISGDQTRPGWQFLNRAPFRSDIGLFSVCFSLPSWAEDFGDLVSVHYDYYKYRTDWIYSFNDPDDWEAIEPYVGMEALGEDMQYAEGRTPNFGFVFMALMDRDDIETGDMALMDRDDIETGDEKIEGEMPYARFYNNPLDTPIELRVDNPKWAFFLDDAEWEDGHRYTSEELLSYARSYEGDTDPSGDLPVLNGTVSDELFYVPSYSRQALFQKYGHVEDEISREDILGENLSGLIQARMESTGVNPTFHGGTGNLGGLPFYMVGLLGQGEIRIDGVDTSGIGDEMPLSDLYVEAMSATDPGTYAWTLGEDSVPLLADWLRFRSRRDCYGARIRRWPGRLRLLPRGQERLPAHLRCLADELLYRMGGEDDLGRRKLDGADGAGKQDGCRVRLPVHRLHLQGRFRDVHPSGSVEPVRHHRRRRHQPHR